MSLAVPFQGLCLSQRRLPTSYDGFRPFRLLILRLRIIEAQNISTIADGDDHDAIGISVPSVGSAAEDDRERADEDDPGERGGLTSRHSRRTTDPIPKHTRRKPARYSREASMLSPEARSGVPARAGLSLATIATTTHLVSVPKIMGIGPIMITPAAFTSALLLTFLCDDDVAAARKMIAMPAITAMKTQSANNRTSDSFSRGALYIPSKQFPEDLRWQSTGTARSA